MVACLHNLIFHSRIPNHHCLSSPLSSYLDILKCNAQAPNTRNINISSTFWLRVRFTFETPRDFNLSFRWFGFSTDKRQVGQPLSSDLASMPMKMKPN
jgi:hypothetical protein